MAIQKKRYEGVIIVARGAFMASLRSLACYVCSPISPREEGREKDRNKARFVCLAAL